VTTDLFATAATLIQEADGLLVTAGAGMGIDSGLPDFRGAQGFWKAYPGLAKSRMHFQDIACPDAFRDTPELAWGFYGHRLALYRATLPHRGFEILRNIGERMANGSFVFTSNVDGQFQKAGFTAEKVQECHGSIHLLQCMQPCNPSLWDAAFDPVIDEVHCRMISRLPVCPECGATARPNIMMFHDWNWHDQRARVQAKRFTEWRARVNNPVIIELGAGTHIPSVRLFSESQARFGKLVRINPNESGKPSWAKGVSIPTGALEAMDAINDSLYEAGFWEGA
jgi:NAD-dependent SIR2 family protein deacetylase